MTEQTSKITVERRFDVTTNITEDWFRLYVSEVGKYGSKWDAGNFDVRIRCDFNNRVAFSTREAWLDYVREYWNEITETSISQYGGVVEFATCNHRRHHVAFTLVADSVFDIDQTCELLCQALSLTISPENPYRYRRSSLEFEIGNWRPDSFVAGIKRIAEFCGPCPDVPEAYAKSFDGDIEKLTPFFDLNSFCERVGMRASRFEEIAIRMQARSIGIGVSVTSDHKKLRVRTSLPPDELDPLIAAWPDELKLKPVKATDPGAAVGGIAPPAGENPWLKYLLPVFLAFVTAVSTASAVSLKKAIWPEYKVAITSPLVQSGTARWSGSVISIDWYLEPDQPSFRSVQKDVIATVKVHAPSGSQRPVESKPPVSLSLEPGNYIVVVDAPSATPAQFQLIVEKPTTQVP